MNSKNYYVTTTLPYVNAEAHIGTALELIRADALVRTLRQKGVNVFFNTGTDEHGLKIFEKAKEEGMQPKEYVDKMFAKFTTLYSLLGMTDDIKVIRTTDEYHVLAAQELWKRVDERGFIEKKKYSAKYCVGCELEKTNSELVDGKCPEHPEEELQDIEEENYFFKFSQLEEPLLEYFNANPHFVTPDFRHKEMITFLESGLKDFSISRLKEKMPWGVSVPGDEEHVMYVWFDALTNYISTLGWPEDKSGDYKKYWEDGYTIQIAGKDNLRQQSLMWQAMLMAAGLPQTNKIYIEGFITAAGGVKMSKSIGNIIDPKEIIKAYGTDTLRYVLLRHAHPFDDTSLSTEMIHGLYNAHLVNGLGNLISRLLKMIVSYEVEVENPKVAKDNVVDIESIINFQSNLDDVWQVFSDADKEINLTEPFKTIKTDPDKAKQDLKRIYENVYTAVLKLEPYMPETYKKIYELFEKKMVPSESLFPRIEK